MDAKDLKKLKHIHGLMLALEKATGFDPGILAELKTELLSFASHEVFELQKLAEIPAHLHADMTLKHFVSWIVPIERVLQKELRDDEFLVYSTDTAQKNVEKIPLVFVLNNLRSAFNVGSIFRTAECFGVQKIYLCGYTPIPTQEKLAKTAMGTQELVSWQEVSKIYEAISDLKSEGFRIVAFETTSHAKELAQEFPRRPTAFIFGNERFGVDPEILSLCDETRIIPLVGQKNSLNVGVATAIATYEFAKQWRA